MMYSIISWDSSKYSNHKEALDNSEFNILSSYKSEEESLSILSGLDNYQKSLLIKDNPITVSRIPWLDSLKGSK
jgi:hypothetical protein